MVEGHGPLVGEEDFPLVKPDCVFGGGRRGQQRLRQRLGQGAARDGDLEDVVPVKRRRLTLDNVGPQVRRENVDRGEHEQIGRSASHGSVGGKTTLSTGPKAGGVLCICDDNKWRVRGIGRDCDLRIWVSSLRRDSRQVEGGEERKQS